jgi:acetyltransferase-like isoleucine patch superfamily enzyme
MSAAGTIKRAIGSLIHVEPNIRMRMALARWFYARVPLIGGAIGIALDRTLLRSYGLDVRSDRVDVARLTMSHPNGVLLGGNGIVSPGRVSIMSGVKFVGRSPIDPEYLKLHAEKRVFTLGDNVVIGVNSVIVGPLEITSNVVIAPMSLVNRSITEPGVYGGIPARLLKDEVPGEEWVAFLGEAPGS